MKEFSDMKRSEIQEILKSIDAHVPGQWEVSCENQTYVRRFMPQRRLILLGGGYIAQALCRLAPRLDFAVTDVDDRPDFANHTLFPDAETIICDDFQKAVKTIGITQYDFVTVLTRGHRWDGHCLRAIFDGTMPAYLGMVGSRRRIAGLYDLLASEGYDRRKMEVIHAPVGLSIGAVTPDEIAVSIAAELIQARHDLPRDPNVLVQEDADRELLCDLAENTERAAAVVIETKGSVPTKTGAVMAADMLGRTAGTVGGGCGEFAVVTAAREVLKSGAPKLIDIDMTNEVTDEDGMVCGGTMKVWVEKLTD